jgi:hypothetical protein
LPLCTCAQFVSASTCSGFDSVGLGKGMSCVEVVWGRVGRRDNDHWRGSLHVRVMTLVLVKMCNGGACADVLMVQGHSVLHIAICKLFGFCMRLLCPLQPCDLGIFGERSNEFITNEVVLFQCQARYQTGLGWI